MLLSWHLPFLLSNRPSTWHALWGFARVPAHLFLVAPCVQVLAEMARKVKPLWQRTCSMCPGRPAPQGQG